MIPAELRALKGWLVWRLEPNTRQPGGKPLKVPYYVEGGRRRGVQGSAEDRERWATWEAAQAIVDDDLVGEWGLGFALSADWGIVGLDFDACVDERGVVDAEVEQVISGTYAEFSPSGRGVHAFLTGKLPNRKSRAEDGRWGFEVFCTTGFLTMTGRPTPVCELVGWEGLGYVNGAVTELCEARFGSGGIRVRAGAGGALVVRGKGYSEDVLRAMLWKATPDGSYGEWVKRGMALHHETGGAPWGCALWNEHSMMGKDYAGVDLIESKWAGFGRDGAGGGELVTVAYLERLALAPSADVFDVVVEPEPEPGALPPPQFSRNRGGAILPTMDNAVLAVGRADVCGMRIGHDEFRDEITVSRPGVDEWTPMTDADVVRLMIALERLGFKTASKEMVRSAVVLVAAQGRYDSAQLWLSGLAWDGKERVRGFLSTYLGVESSGAGSYGEAVSLYMWTALAGRVLVPGVKADMVPILEGAQGLRKSSAIEAMSPAPEFFVEIDLGEKEDDTVRKLRGALVAEIAELSGLHTRDLEGIKKFVVRKTEKWVPKYKEFPSTFKRRLIFVGTTNRVEILADDTGNRRWLPVHIELADAEGIARDCLQLWAEGAVLFRDLGVAWQDAERLAPAAHQSYAMSDAWDGRVHGWLSEADDAALALDGSGAGAGPRTRGGSPFTTADALAGAVGLAAKDMNRAAANRVSAILRTFGYEQRTTRKGEDIFRAWHKQRSEGSRNAANVT